MKKANSKPSRSNGGKAPSQDLEYYPRKARPPSEYEYAPYRRESSRELDRVKVIAIYSLIGIGALTGIYFLGRHLVRTVKRTRTESKSLEEGNPANYAKQLKMAFDNDNWAGWGTNEKMVFQIFKQIPSNASYKKVLTAYKNLYAEDLNSRLESELSSEEFSTVMSIINAKK